MRTITLTFTITDEMDASAALHNRPDDKPPVVVTSEQIAFDGGMAALTNIVAIAPATRESQIEAKKQLVPAKDKATVDSAEKVHDQEVAAADAKLAAAIDAVIPVAVPAEETI